MSTENLKLPAFPEQVTLHPTDQKPFTASEMNPNTGGFTKLEMASLMIAQGLVSANPGLPDKTLAEFAVGTAKALLEEVNK